LHRSRRIVLTPSHSCARQLRRRLRPSDLHRLPVHPQVRRCLHHTLAIVFFAIGLLQALSFQAAVRVAARIGLLRTMVFTHLPSNLLLAAIAFAPTLPAAIALLLARFALSQMDVPTRQAYVMAVVDPSERTAAAAYTNTARYLTRPVAPLLAGAAIRGALGLPFLLAGALKSVYDLGLYLIFRDVPLRADE
jgi:MFS family permease